MFTGHCRGHLQDMTNGFGVRSACGVELETHVLSKVGVLEIRSSE